MAISPTLALEPLRFAKPYGDTGPSRFLPAYDHIIDYMLLNPTATIVEIAAFVGYSKGWVAIVKNSDAFRTRYAQRRDELNQQVQDSVANKLGKAASGALDKLLDRIEEKGDSMPTAELVDLNDRLLGKLGYGAKPGAAAVNVNVAAIAGAAPPPLSAADLHDARAALRAAEAARAAGIFDARPEQAVSEVDKHAARPMIDVTPKKGEDDSALLDTSLAKFAVV